MENVKKYDRESEETIADVIATMSEEQKNVMDELIGKALSDNEEIEPIIRRRLANVIATMSEEQKNAMCALIGVALCEKYMLGILVIEKLDLCPKCMKKVQSLLEKMKVNLKR